MISRLFLWEWYLILLPAAIWALVGSIAETDEAAAQKNLDSICKFPLTSSFISFFPLTFPHIFPSLLLLAFRFDVLTAKTDIGTISATLDSTRNTTSCIPTQIKFGPYSGSRLTVGPNHNPWYEPNQFFLALSGCMDGLFIASVQSSLTSLESNMTWWNLQAWQNTTVHEFYEVQGTMRTNVYDSIGEERNQISGVWEVAPDKVRRSGKLSDLDDTEGATDNPCQKGTKYLLHESHVMLNTTLKGQVSPEDAHMEVTGSLVLSLDPTSDAEEADDAGNGDSTEEKRDRLVRRHETRDMSYTITFSGRHYSGSAPLPTNGLVWQEAGPGPPLPPYKFTTLELPTSQTVSTTHSTTSTPSTPSTPTIIPSTILPPVDQDTNIRKPEKGALPHGSIIGIIVGGVLAVLVFMGMLFFIKSQRAKKKEPRVYPELAYIYSTPFSTMGKRNQGGSSQGGVEGITGNSGASSYYGAAPHLEVSLGDQAPFLGPLGSMEATRSPATMSGALLDGSEEREANRTRLEEQEEMEREMRQPMLPGALHYEQPPTPPAKF